VILTRIGIRFNHVGPYVRSLFEADRQKNSANCGFPVEKKYIVIGRASSNELCHEMTSQFIGIRGQEGSDFAKVILPRADLVP